MGCNGKDVICCTDRDGDGFSVEGGECGPVDCDDTKAGSHPGATEICGDAIDQDCDGKHPRCCKDADGDRFSAEGGECGPVDCDDTKAGRHPGATEICGDGIDQDCDGKDPRCCKDNDGDGFSAEGGECGPVDCDDSKAAIHPGAKEICEDKIDQDCDGKDLPCVLKDADGDLWSIGQGDCNDSNSDIFPGATDFPGNGIDENCDGKDAVSPRVADMDFDGYTAEAGDCHDQNPNVHPGAVEIQCNGIDEDCDGADLCNLTPQVQEKSGFIDGEVYDARSEKPIEGATIKMANIGQVQTSKEGKFSIPTPNEGVYLILIEKEDYTYAQRRIRVESDHDFAVEPVYLVPIDPVSATITPEAGGKLVNSTNDVELHFKPGDVAETVEVSATRYYDSRELPGDLPPTSHFTTALELLPDGLTLKNPVRILVENTFDFAPGTPVPVGYYRKDLGMWVPDGMGKITDDGKYMEYYAIHCSPIDCNYSRSTPANAKPPSDEKVTDESKKTNEPDSGDKEGKEGCRVIYRDGELIEDYNLPAYRSLGKTNIVSLTYSSNSADHKAMLSLEYDLDPDEAAIPEKVEFEVSIAGKKEKGIYSGDKGKIDLRYLFDGINGRAERVPSGEYPYTIKLTNWYPVYFNAAPRFGDQPVGYILDSQGNPVRASQDASLRKELNGGVFLNNQVGSPFGAGWNVADLQRIYGSPYSSSITLVSGSGGKLHFEREQKIGTLAGNGTGGYSGDGGPATQASLFCPLGVAVDGAGNVYIAEFGNKRIRRVDPDGIITTIAGNGNFGYSGDGGPATQASLSQVSGVAVDGAGNVYIANLANQRIRRVDPAGIITTIAGNGTRGHSGDGGPATQASLFGPSRVAVDGAGNVYIADSWNSYIRRVDPAGIITTIAGNGAGYLGDGGPAVQARLSSPFGVAVDGAGNVYIADEFNSRIRRVDPTGIITTIAGNGTRGYSGDGGPATQAKLTQPHGVAVDGAGNVYIGDLGNQRIRRVDPSGIITTIAGNGIDGYSGDGGPATQASLSCPEGVAVDGAGNVYIADSRNDRIRIIKDTGFGMLSDKVDFLSPEGDYSKLTRHGDGTYTRITKDGTTYRFNAKGLQTSKIGTNGQTTAYAYDESDRLISITDPAGLVTTFTYSGSTLVSITDPARRTTRFTHDTNNNLTSIIAPDGSTTNLTYDSRHLMTSKTDPLRRTTQFNYDKHGMVETVVWPDEGVDQYSPSASLGLINDLPEGVGTDKNPTKALAPPDDLHIDQEGTATYMKTDKYGRLSSKTDDMGNTTTYERDLESGNITAIHAPNGATIRNTYDDKGNLVSSTDGKGNTTTYTYESTFNKVKTITDPLGKVTTFDYDTKGNLIKITDPLRKTTTMTYYGNGLIHTLTDANGATTTYEYDSRGNLTRRTDSLSQQTTYTYDAAGNRTSATDALGHTTTYAYDAMNNLTDITDPEGGHITYTYDDAGNRTSMTDAREYTTLYSYDSMDRLIKATDPSGHEVSYTYDKTGKVLSMTDAKGAVTTYEYDALGNLVKEIDFLGHQTIYSYDAMGNRITVTDAKGNTTRYEHDLNNQVTKAIDPLNGETRFIYDGNGNPLSITDAKGQTTQLAYDSLNRKISMTNPLEEKESYSYDNNGNLARKGLPNGDTITYEYDNLGRLLKKVLANGGITTYTYDRTGNLTSVTNTCSSLYFSYDQNNRPMSIHTAATAYQPETTITCTYDANGNRLSMTDPYSWVTQYTYDALDNLATITAPNNQLTGFTYDQNGRRASKVLPNGLTSLYSYNANSDLTSIAHNLGAAALSSYGYEYDAAGNRTRMTELSGNHNYAYDKLNQLLQADHPQIQSQIPTETFTYDAVGNRLASVSSARWSYDTDNRLLDDGTFTYQYTNGCLTHKTNKSTGKVTTYTYDSENQLTGITMPGSAVFYSYDGLGRRICKEANGVKTYYLYDGEDILFTLDSSYHIIARYTHGPGIDDPIQMDQGSASYYYLMDGLGSTTRMVDFSGNIQQEYTYDSFGNVVNKVGSLDNVYAYTGREYDPESGLYYYRTRYYDPKSGRFLQPDPIGFDGGDVNLYRYVKNNPIGLVDPWGLCGENINREQPIEDIIDAVVNDPQSEYWKKMPWWIAPLENITPENYRGAARNWQMVIGNFPRIIIDKIPGVDVPLYDPTEPDVSDLVCVGIEKATENAIKNLPGVANVKPIPRYNPDHVATLVTFEDGTQLVFDWHATLNPSKPKIQPPNEWLGK